MTGFVLALLASASWGVSDFLGGLKTRSVPLPVVLAVSQVAGMAVLVAVLAAHHRPAPYDPRLWWAVGAGAASPAALGLLYSAMAKGSIAVVAPVAASGAVLPVLVGIARGDTIGRVAWLGIVLALAGALGAAWDPGASRGRGNLVAGGLLALGSASATGLFFAMMDVGSRADPYWATLIARSTACLAVLGLLGMRRGSARGTRLTPLAVVALAAIGFTDALAEVFFAVASTAGELGVVAVLSSLYPAVTVALALILLRERVHWLRGCAAAGVVAGVVLLGYATAG